MNARSPAPRPLGVSDIEAIELCREWMVYLGVADVAVASGDARKLCDLYGSHFLAWVDNRDHNLGIETVERAARVCAADGRRGIVFTPGGIFPDAQDAADAVGVALLRFDPYNGDLDGANMVGRSLLLHGLGG